METRGRKTYTEIRMIRGKRRIEKHDEDDAETRARLRKRRISDE